MIGRISILLLMWLICTAQKAPDLTKFDTRQKKMQAWAEHCDNLIYYEDLTGLQKAAKHGIAMAPPKDYYNKSLFYFYGGVSFDHLIQPDSAAYYYEKSLYYARMISHSKRIMEALTQLSYVYVNTGTTAKRLATIHELENIADTSSNALQKAKIEQTISNYYINTGLYEKGLELLLNALKIRKIHLKEGNETDSINYGVVLVNVADLYINMNNVKKGLDYLSESMLFMRNYAAGIIHVQKTFVKVYLQQNELTKATSHYKELQQYLHSLTEKNMLSIAESDVLFADYYLHRKNLTKAHKYVQHAAAIIENEPNEYTEAIVQQYFGKIHSGKKEYTQALAFYLKAFPVLSQSSAEEKSGIHKLLAETYQSIGQSSKAFDHLSIYSALQDTLLQEKAKKNLAEVEGKYQNDKKQQEIETLQAQTALDQLKISAANKQRIFLLSGLFLLGVIGALLYYQNQLRKRNNQRLQQLNTELHTANKTKNRFLGILNHDLRSPIANLINYLHLQQNTTILDAVQQKQLAKKTISNAENLLESMEDLLLWSKGQLHNFEPQPEQLMVSELFEDVRQHFSSYESIEFLFDKTTMQLYTDENYIKTILRNLTGNAIKALSKTSNPTIHWQSWQIDNHQYLSITDNGPGATLAQFKALYDDSEVVGIQSGLGLHLIRDLAKAIHCDVKVESITDGVKIVLEMNT